MSKSLTEMAREILEENAQGTLKPKSGHADEPKKLGGDVPLALQANEKPETGKAPVIATKKTNPPGKTPPGQETMKSVSKDKAIPGEGSFSTDTSKSSKDNKLKDSVNKQPEEDDELYEDEEFVIGDIVEDTEGNIGEVVAITEDGIEVEWTSLTEEEEKEDDDSEEEEDDSDDEEKETVKEMFRPSVDDLSFDLSEDVNAMFSGEELSEEFKTKVTTIFEAAVRSRVTEFATKLDEAFDDHLKEGVEEAIDVISEATEEYLNVATKKWIQENEIAIQSNLRTELTEDFIAGLRNLFIENYIDIPEDKIDLVEELSVRLEQTESKLNEQIETNIEMDRLIRESKKEVMLSNLTEGLVESEKEKILSLAENIEFQDEEAFEKAINTIKESYFPKTTKSKIGKKFLDEESLLVDETGKVLTEENNNNNDPMDKYLKVLTRQNRQ